MDIDPACDGYTYSRLALYSLGLMFPLFAFASLDGLFEILFILCKFVCLLPKCLSFTAHIYSNLCL